MVFVTFGFVFYALWSVYMVEWYPDRLWIARLGPIIGAPNLKTPLSIHRFTRRFKRGVLVESF